MSSNLSQETVHVRVSALWGRSRRIVKKWCHQGHTKLYETPQIHGGHFHFVAFNNDKNVTQKEGEKNEQSRYFWRAISLLPVSPVGSTISSTAHSLPLIHTRTHARRHTHTWLAERAERGGDLEEGKGVVVRDENMGKRGRGGIREFP